jgi:hypothetical protein
MFDEEPQPATGKRPAPGPTIVQASQDSVTESDEEIAIEKRPNTEEESPAAK